MGWKPHVKVQLWGTLLLGRDATFPQNPSPGMLFLSKRQLESQLRIIRFENIGGWKLFKRVSTSGFQTKLESIAFRKKLTTLTHNTHPFYKDTFKHHISSRCTLKGSQMSWNISSLLKEESVGGCDDQLCVNVDFELKINARSWKYAMGVYFIKCIWLLIVYYGKIQVCLCTYSIELSIIDSKVAGKRFQILYISSKIWYFSLVVDFVYRQAFNDTVFMIN